MTFYWPNRQYYVSGHDKHSAEPLPPVLPSTENEQVKIYQIQARHATTLIFFALMDPIVCPVLNLAVYVEMFGTQDWGRFFLIGRVLADLLSTLKNCLQVLISKQQGQGSLEPTASARVLQPMRASLAF